MQDIYPGIRVCDTCRLTETMAMHAIYFYVYYLGEYQNMLEDQCNHWMIDPYFWKIYVGINKDSVDGLLNKWIGFLILELLVH